MKAPKRPVAACSVGIFCLLLGLPVPSEAQAQAPIEEPTATDTAAQGADDAWVTAIDLLTIGPGAHLWTSFGHTAVTVVRFNRVTKEHQTKVYNWGDADFGGWDFIWSFFRGKALFRLTEMGSLENVVNTYAPLGRTMVQQRFALTPEQVQVVVEGLETFSEPSKRHYVYHHMNATCATKLRDYLDQKVVNGAITQTLGDALDPHTPRYYGRKYFAGFFFAEIFNDLFLGREHDKPWTKYASMTMPESLSAYLQEVMVPDPKGSGELVPLLGKPVPIVRDVPQPPYRGEGRSVIHLSYLLLAIVVGMGLYVLRRRDINAGDAGLWLLVWSVPAVLVSFSMIFGAVMSTVVEGRINELMLVLPPTDVALLWVGYRWARGHRLLPRWLRPYAWVRLGMVVLSLLGHASGVLIQEPRVVVVLTLLATALLVAIVHRLGQGDAQGVQPATRDASPSTEAAA